MNDVRQAGVELGLTHVKSTIRTNPGALTFDDRGMFGDRELMFVEAEGDRAGQFLSQRKDGTMALIRSEVTHQGVVLNHPAMTAPAAFNRVEETEETQTPVSVHKWHGTGVDQGNQAAEWAREIFGRAVRLVRVSDDFPRYVEDNSHLGRVGFSDGYPMLVISKGSVRALSDYLEKHGSPPIEAKNFGYNILLDIDEEFIEDRIKTITFNSDGLVWELIRRKACGRCRLPSRDPETGEMREGMTVLDALSAMGRKGVHLDPKLGTRPEKFFGQNFIVRVPEGLEPRHTGRLDSASGVTIRINDATNWTPVTD